MRSPRPATAKDLNDLGLDVFSEGQLAKLRIKFAMYFLKMDNKDVILLRYLIGSDQSVLFEQGTASHELSLKAKDLRDYGRTGFDCSNGRDDYNTIV